MKVLNASGSLAMARIRKTVSTSARRGARAGAIKPRRNRRKAAW
jgi:hypothetical protein